jgi:glyoxylase-like metal-dependent hydrolase (beta-lactamase superfamily II)
MTLFRVRASVAMLAATGLGLVATASGVVAAQQAQAARRAQPLRTLQVSPQVYLIAGDGGNIAVQVGADGVVLVDSGAGGRPEDVLAAVRAISPRPIRFIINTSAAPDFVGGNTTLAEAGDALGGAGGGAAAVFGGVRSGAARLAHENALLRMSSVAAGKPAFPESAWPTEGFIDTKNLYLNGEAIQLTHQPAVSDSDAIVFFRRSDVLVTGHIIDATRFPMIDVATGGSIQGEIAALNKLIELAVPPTPLVWQEGGTRVIPGHGHVLEQADIVEYRDMVTIIRDVVQSMIKAGMTLEQIRKAEPTRGYTRRYGADSGPWTTAMFVDAVHASLMKGGAR